PVALLVYRCAPHPELPSFPTRRSSDLRATSTSRPSCAARPTDRTFPGRGRPFPPQEPLPPLAGEVPAQRGMGVSSRECPPGLSRDRKSTRLNSSHVKISYAVFCLKKKK